MRRGLMVLGVIAAMSGRARADVSDDGCSASEETCREDGATVVCREPRAAAVTHVTLFVRAGDGPWLPHAMPRTAACTFAFELPDAGDAYYLSTADAKPPDLDTSPPAARVARPHATPGLDGRRLLGEVGVGGLLGFAGGLLGLYAGVGLSGGGDNPIPIFTAYGGAIGGLSLGVWIAGSAHGQRGSLVATFGGAVLGGAAGIGLALTGSPVGEVCLIGLPVTGALIGFNLTRDYDDDAAPPLGSALSFRHGRLRGGVPLVMPARAGAMLSLASGVF